jgi:hypothetical protein
MKITLLVALPLLIVGGGAATAILLIQQRKNTTASSVLSATTSGDGSMKLDSTQGALNIPLTQASPQANNDPNQLHVNSGTATDGSLQQNQLGGGSATGSNSGQSNSSGGSNTPAVPGPDTFKQYDQYKDGKHAMFGEIKVGTGKELAVNMQAAVFYKGWLTDGTLFDQSRLDADAKLQPFVLTIGEHKVITGWEEGLVGMKVGGVRRIIVPPAVGYGTKGQAPIPGNAVLVFDVQLMDAL